MHTRRSVRHLPTAFGLLHIAFVTPDVTERATFAVSLVSLLTSKGVNGRALSTRPRRTVSFNSARVSNAAYGFCSAPFTARVAQVIFMLNNTGASAPTRLHTDYTTCVIAKRFSRYARVVDKGVAVDRNCAAVYGVPIPDNPITSIGV